MRLRWERGRSEATAPAGPSPRAEEWLGLDDAGNAVARVVHVAGPIHRAGGLCRAVALDEEAKLVRLLPPAPEGTAWLALIDGRVVGRAAMPLEAVRSAEAALAR